MFGGITGLSKYTHGMRAAVYLRQSLDRTGEALAVARQRKDCLKLCEQHGWEPVEYIDNDTSASTGKRRPAYEKMLTDILDGRVGAVVAWDLDRLHRRPIELEAFMALADEKHLALATVSGDVDLSTAQGRLMARLKGNVAAHEVEHKAARQRVAARQKAERGLPQWTRAFGYLGDTHQPDPVTAPLVKEAYAAVLAGASLNDVCRLWNGAGALTLNGKMWTPPQVSNFLRKARNAGLRSHTDTKTNVTEIVGKGTWPALVDEDTWRAAQAVLNAAGRAPGRKTVRRHKLTGALQCGKCGHHLSGMQTMQKTITYRCKACLGVSIAAAEIEPFLLKLIGRRLALPDAVDLLRADLHDSAEAERLRTEANTLLARLDEIADERADGLLTGAQAQRATERINGKLAAIERQQQDQERLRVFDGIPIGRPEAVDAVKRLSDDRLRAVIDVLAAPIVIEPVGKGGYVVDPVTKRKHMNPERVKPKGLLR